jgi:CheY-like chemotaxis protein
MASPAVLAQSFVAAYGVRSVFGFGTTIWPGESLVLIGFSRAFLEYSTEQAFETVALYLKAVWLNTREARAALRGSYEQLYADVLGEIVSSHESHLKSALAELQRTARSGAARGLGPGRRQRTEDRVSQGAESNVPRRVLIVDDNADGAEMLELALRALGHSTRVTYDGASALVAAQEFRPDVALLDIGLPLMDGFELARRMRAEMGAQAPVLIAVTGYGQEADRERTRLAGFTHHLVKPIGLDELGALIAAPLPTS